METCATRCSKVGPGGERSQGHTLGKRNNKDDDDYEEEPPAALPLFDDCEGVGVVAPAWHLGSRNVVWSNDLSW